MSYDLAVWEGERPDTDEEASAQFARVMAGRDSGEPPTDRIRAYVADLLQRWPEDDVHVDDAPWAAGPLIDEAFADAIYFSVTPSRVDEVVEFATELAVRQGLVCYDPQQGALRTVGVEPADGAPPRSARGWLNWLRETIFG